MVPKILSQADIDFVNNLMVEAGKLASALQPNTDSLSTGPTADQKVSYFLVSQLQERFIGDIIISEEDLPDQIAITNERTWLVDPIDGTYHYLDNDIQYSIMIGLLSHGQPVFGWVYIPAFSLLYYGGPKVGLWRSCKTDDAVQSIQTETLIDNKSVRLLVGRRDYKHNPWLENIADATVIQAGSIGFKLVKILENQADMLIHLAGCLKVWDTAGPVALALAAGFDVGNEKMDKLPYPEDTFTHRSAVVIGKKGSLSWFRTQVLKARPQ